ncbi:MAG TPA: cell division protein FtsZ [Methanomassiliicoccales archaeon]|nr:cell division protein FtsZ [Methanomassiliicoccales archaeon]
MGSRFEGLDESEVELHELNILVVGCGGGGCNSITRLNQIGIEAATTVAINTDQRSLKVTECPNRLLIGAEYTKGLGTGGRPDVGEECALNASVLLSKIFQGVDLTFIITGLGGGTGTGASPVVADIARRCGSMVITIATTPFSFEGATRRNIALKGLKRLRDASNSMLVLDNDRLLHMVENIPVDQGLAVIDQLISELIKGTVDVLTLPSLINLDFADLRTIMEQGGVSTILYGENADPEAVVREAIENPLLDVDIRGGTGALIHIAGGSGLTMRRANRIIASITKVLDEDATIKFGVRMEEEMEGNIRMIAIITGISEMSGPFAPTFAPGDDLGKVLGKYSP